MPQPFPGVDAPVSGGSSGPGVYKLPFPAGGGVFPSLQEMVGGDSRYASSYAPSIEGLTNRTNYLFMRTPDWISGFDGRSLFKGNVKVANTLMVDHSAISDSGTAVIGIGGANNGAGGSFTGSGNGNGVEGFASGTGFAAVYGVGGTTGYGVYGMSGTGAVAAVRGDAHTGSNADGVLGVGDGTGAGVRGTGSIFGPALAAHLGPVYIDTAEIGGQDPGQNCMWANMFPKAWIHVSYDGAGGVTINGDVNINHSTTTILSANVAQIGFVRAMASQYYAVSWSILNGMATNRWVAQLQSMTSGGFTFKIYVTTEAAVDFNAGGVAFDVMFTIVGAQ